MGRLFWAAKLPDDLEGNLRALLHTPPPRKAERLRTMEFSADDVVALAIVASVSAATFYLALIRKAAKKR